MYFKKIKIILLIFLLYQSPIHSKSNSFSGEKFTYLNSGWCISLEILTNQQKLLKCFSSHSKFQFCLHKLKQVYQKDVAQKKTQNIYLNENNCWYEWILKYSMQNVSEWIYEDYNISSLISYYNFFEVLLALVLQNVSSIWCFQPVKSDQIYRDFSNSAGDKW